MAEILTDSPLWDMPEPHGGAHYKVVCQDHGTIYTECRCSSINKVLKTEECRGGDCGK